MGSQVKLNGKLIFKIEVACNVPVGKIDIVKDGLDSKSYIPQSNELDISWDTTEPPLESDAYYYIRVTLSDGVNLAWSSPIWVSI